MKENHIMDRISAEYSGYVISEEMLDDIFFERAWLLSTNDKKKIVIQRLYSGYRGLGVIDELRDLKIESQEVYPEKKDSITVYGCFIMES